MIYGDDVTPRRDRGGVAYLCKTEGLEERKAAIAAIAGATEIGLRADPKANRRVCAPAASWQLPRISASVEPRRAGRCWRHAVSTTSWPGLTAFISRPPNSAVGEPGHESHPRC